MIQPSTYLIYDSASSGHHTEFIEYLLQYLLDQSNELIPNVNQYVFLIPAKTCLTLKDLVNQAKENILILPISDEEQKQIDTATNRSKQMAFEGSILRGYIQTCQINHIIFMALDSYQTLVAQWAFTQPQLTVSGILFMPSVRMPIIKNNVLYFIKSFLEKGRDTLKHCYLSLNKNLKNIYVLNDEKSAAKLNQMIFWNKKFVHLPDPIPIRSVSKAWILRGYYNIESDRKIFLCFGSIDKRKNILNILEAVSLVPTAMHSQIALLILGKCTDKLLQKKITDKIDEIGKAYPHLNVIIDDRFLSIEEMENAFEQSDVVLIPYLGFYFSSGLLGHATKHSKYIIASNIGLMSDLVETYQLGTTVNAHSPLSIAQAFSNFIEQPKQIDFPKTFIETHNPTYFAIQLLNS